MGGRTLDQFRSIQNAKQQAKSKEPAGTAPKRDTDGNTNRKG